MPRTMPVYDPEPISYVSSGEDESNLGFPGQSSVLEPAHSHGSNYSINAKPTHATLAETFSDPNHSYEFADARDDLGSREVGTDYYANTNGLEYVDSEDTGSPYHHKHNVGGLEYVDSEEEAYAAKGMHQNEAEGQYYRHTNGLEYADSETEQGFELGDGTATTYDNETLGYTVNEDGYYEENTAFQDETGYPHNPNEGTARAVHSRSDGMFSAHLEETSLGYETGYETCDTKTLNTNLEGMNYVSDDPMAHDPHYEASQGYYYDDQEQYYAPNEYDDSSPSQHQAAGRASVGTAISKRATSRAINDEFGSDDESGPMDSYDSEDSGSSWDDGSASRDVSLLDSADSQDLGDDSFDDDISSLDSRRGRRRPATMFQLINQMKNCALKGASASYEDGDFEFLPDVALVSTNASSKSSITDGSSQKRRRRRKSRGNGDTDSLFGRMSALGEEFIGKNGEVHHRGKGSRRNRSRSQSTRIMDSLRVLFSCGAPSNY